ncbi:tripartite tricarboxylate transporter permease [Piscinibacter sakaiensis]|uniref:tripartite tricarboxylate transporter permease n=1 Tax=Piscinibacter sakaiensis TaxID=1547922 RepID=UPI003AADA1CD
MTLFDNLALGVSIASQQQHLLLLTGGCLLGATFAALPGVGMLSLVALALPAALLLEPLAAMMLLVGIYCGAAGGAQSAGPMIAAPLLSDGSGEPVPASGMTVPAVWSMRWFAAARPLSLLVASLIGAFAIVMIAPSLIELTFRFGPAEYFSMMVLALLAVVVLAAGSLLKSMSMLVFGLLLAQIGSDPQTGLARFDFDYLPFDAGIGLVPMALGLVVIGRLLSELLGGAAQPLPSPAGTVPHRLPLRQQLQQDALHTARGGAVGSLFGTVPGGGVAIGAYVARGIERRLQAGRAGDDARPAGTAAAAAISAGTRSSFIPLLALGVPTNAALVLMVGLLLQRGQQVGPQLMTGHAELFWGLIAAIAFSGVVLFVFGRPLGMLARRLESVDFAMVYPVLGAFCCLAAYALPGGIVDVLQMSLFGALGHLLFKLGCPLTPLLMGFVLGPTLESSLRHALELSAGDWSILLTRPLSAGLLLAGALLVASLLLPSVRPLRAALFRQER